MSMHLFSKKVQRKQFERHESVRPKSLILCRWIWTLQKVGNESEAKSHKVRYSGFCESGAHHIESNQVNDGDHGNSPEDRREIPRETPPAAFAAQRPWHWLYEYVWRHCHDGGISRHTSLPDVVFPLDYQGQRSILKDRYWGKFTSFVFVTHCVFSDKMNIQHLRSIRFTV